MSQNLQTELQEKFNEATRRLPLPQLLEKLGLAAHAKKSARCPFPGHDDKHPSFSVFQGKDGFWFWKCHAGCGEGDEILFLRKLKGLSMTEAMNLYLDMAGFPAHRPHKSHEYPSVSSVSKSRESPSVLVSESPESPESLSVLVSESPVYPVYPVSNGQGLDGKKQKALKALAARNACTERSTARKRRFKLLRDLRAVEKGIGRELDSAELTIAFDEWHRLSLRFLDPAKARDDYLAAFLAELGKVRVPTSEGDTLNKAREAVSKLAPSELPVIPGMPEAPESWRRLAALHCELSRLCANGIYFLSYRDAAKAYDGLSPQSAYNITLALARLGVIKILCKGKARSSGGKAAEFRYLLSQSGNGTAEIAA
jgi:hypothetical protein